MAPFISQPVPIIIGLPKVVWKERFLNTSAYAGSVNQTQIVISTPVSKLFWPVSQWIDNSQWTCTNYSYSEQQYFHRCLSVRLSLTSLTQKATEYFSMNISNTYVSYLHIKFIAFCRNCIKFDKGYVITFNNSSRVDINYMSNVVRDKRNIFSDINILQKALKQAKVDISIEPTRNVNIPIYLHHTDETYNWGIKRSKFFMHTCWKT